MNKSRNNNLRLAGFVLLLFLIVLLGYVTELKVMMNYLKVASFWRLGLLIGAGLGMVVGFWLRKKMSTSEQVAQLQVFFAAFFFCLLATPLVLSWTNRIASSPPSPVSVTIESEMARYGDRFGQVKGKTAKASVYILFFLLDNQLYRVTNRVPFFPEAQAGDQVTLNINTGRWGYRWVDASSH